MEDNPTTTQHRLYYYTVLIEDTIYLVGWDTQTVLRAHVPTLISGAESSVWETLPDTKYAWSSTVIIGNSLLTVGGRDKSYNFFTSIRMYDPTTKHWIRVGDLPELLDFPCCIIINSELFVFHCQSVRSTTPGSVCGYMSFLILMSEVAQGFQN